MPIRFDQLDHKEFQDCHQVGMTEGEVVELAQAFRHYGFFRIDLDTGHFFATPDVFRIFGMETTSGPLNMVEFRSRIHPEDMPMLMESFERTCAEKQSYHNIYRALNADNQYKFVRTVGKFRAKDNGSGEIVGMTYEFFERLRTAAFSDGEE